MPATESADKPLRLTDRKRLDILRAARDEFREHGFPATSMDRIAARAQVSKRTVYNHFASKDELFKAIVTEIFQQSIHATEFRYDADAPLEEQLLQIAQQEVDLLRAPEFIGLVRVTLAEAIRSPELAREMFDGIGETETGLVGWIKQAARDGRLSVTDAKFAATQFTALIKSAIFWPQIFGGQPAPSQRDCAPVIRSATAMFLAHYATERRGD